MPNTAHVATLEVYEIKASLGGGFRGTFFVRETKDLTRSDRFDTLAEARHWCRTKAYNEFGTRAGYQLASVRQRSGYRCNVWVAV